MVIGSHGFDKPNEFIIKQNFPKFECWYLWTICPLQTNLKLLLKSKTIGIVDRPA